MGKIDIEILGSGILIIAFLAVTLFVFSSWQVNAGEYGVLLQLGEVKDVWNAGLHFRIPFITEVHTLSSQTMKYEVSASAASNDLQTVSTNVAVNYHISNNPEQIKSLFSQFRGAHEDRIIAPFVQEAVKSNTAKFTANDLIKNRENVKSAITDQLTTKLLPYGITVEQISITNFDFSKEFNDAIEAKVVVEQQKAQAQLELEKKQIDVMKLVAEQNATAIAQVIQADADARSNMLRAAGEANATLTKAYAQKQAIEMIQHQLTPTYIQYTYANQWDGKLPYLMGSNGMLLNFGMDNLQTPTSQSTTMYNTNGG